MFLVGHLWSAATDTRMTATAPGSLPRDLVPNRQMLNRISKSPKSNHISNRSYENRILTGQIESREAIQLRFKSNRDWDLPITDGVTDKQTNQLQYFAPASGRSNYAKCSVSCRVTLVTVM